MLWQKLKGKDGGERVKGSSSTKRQIKGFDVVRLKEDITVELMTCLIEAFSMLSEEVIACECEACSDRVRRLLVRQMTLIHFFETESNEEGKSCVLGNQPIQIIIRDGPHALSITWWKEKEFRMKNVERLVKDPLGSEALCRHASEFPGTVKKIKSVLIYLFSSV